MTRHFITFKSIAYVRIQQLWNNIIIQYESSLESNATFVWAGGISQ